MLITFEVNNVNEFAKVRILDVVYYGNAFLFKLRYKRFQIVDSIVDHEVLRGRVKILCRFRKGAPRSRPLLGRVRVFPRRSEICPVIICVETQMRLVPLSYFFWVFTFKKDTANARYFFSYLRC